MNKLTKYAQELGRKGGKASVKSRFKGKSKEEISKMMRDIRKSRQKYSIKEIKVMAKNKPQKKYQLVAYNTGFICDTKEDCYKILDRLGIPLQ